jgi:competence protein ComEC
MKVPIQYFKNEKLEIGGAVLYFLNDEEINNLNNESTNDRSAVFKLVYGRKSFLFTGDVEKGGEAYYSEKYKNFLDSDVLKVSHHGSKTSSTEVFLNYVTPEISLVSAGFKNKFGHPADVILERLRSSGSLILRTDIEKAILLQTNGFKITLINW